MATSSAAPAQWWESAQVVPVDDYQAPVYSPNSVAEINHDGFSGIRENQFDPSNKDYTNGIIWGVCLMLLIGVLMCFLTPLIYCLVGRKACCCRKAKRKAPGGNGTKICFWVLWLIAAAGAGVSLGGFIDLNSQVNDASDIMVEAAGIVTGVQSLAYNALGTAATIIDAIDNLLENAQQCVIAQVDVQYLTDLRTQLENIITRLVQVQQSTALQDISTKLLHVNQQVDNTVVWRRNLVIVIFTFDLACLLAFAAIGYLVVKSGGRTSDMSKRTKCCVTCLVVPLAMLIAVGSWGVLAAASAGAMLDGDFCQNPNANVLVMVKDNPLVTFYMTCTGDNEVYTALEVAQEAMLQAATSLAPKAAQLETLAQRASPSCQTLVTTFLTNFNNASYQLFNVLGEAQTALSCRTINGLFVDAVHQTACDDLNNSIGLLFLGLLMLSVPLMLAVLVWRLMVAQAEALEKRYQEEEDMNDAEAVAKTEGMPLKSGAGGKVMQDPAAPVMTVANPGTVNDVKTLEERLTRDCRTCALQYHCGC
eukprot:TRINITY_DN4113_c0_g1_i1.p1 TRINITY_DN4113_c0_g1~~TRINITY_DN4113_c0_g1_i1.p1  ORF type:complete len:534 (+),score=125.27 TRINITY_DN4113_c0_g1_i1:2115-3716(+)